MMNEESVILVNRVTRSTVAVIDTISSRGGFKGEELSTIGQLRDQCITLIQQVEAAQSDDVDEEEPDFNDNPED